MRSRTRWRPQQNAVRKWHEKIVSANDGSSRATSREPDVLPLSFRGGIPRLRSALCWDDRRIEDQRPLRFRRLAASPLSGLRVQTKSQMRVRLDIATSPIHWRRGRRLRPPPKQKLCDRRHKPCRKPINAARATAPELVTDRCDSIRVTLHSRSDQDAQFGIEGRLLPRESPAISGPDLKPWDRQNILAVLPPASAP